MRNKKSLGLFDDQFRLEKISKQGDEGYCYPQKC